MLHNRCVEVGERFRVPIITKSTFNNKPGTIINNKIEGTTVKSIVKNDDVIYIHAKSEKYNTELFNKIYYTLIENNITAKNLVNNSTYSLDISFYIKNNLFNKFANLLETDLNMLECTYYNVSRISIIGHGIMNDNNILQKAIKIFEINKCNILNIDVTEYKISVVFKDIVSNNILEQLHNEIIK